MQMVFSDIAIAQTFPPPLNPAEPLERKVNTSFAQSVAIQVNSAGNVSTLIIESPDSNVNVVGFTSSRKRVIALVVALKNRPYCSLSEMANDRAKRKSDVISRTAVFIFKRSNTGPNRGTAIPATIPMITTVIISSSRVNPWELFLLFFISTPLLLSRLPAGQGVITTRSLASRPPYLAQGVPTLSTK